MEHNPLAEEVAAKAAQIERLEERRTVLMSDLDWHDGFDRATATQAVASLQVEKAALEAEKVDVRRQLAADRQEGEGLRRKAKLGANPAYWFSPVRHAAKVRGAELYRILVNLEERETRLTGRLKRTRKALRNAQQTLTRFDDLDVEATGAAIEAVDAELTLLRLDHDNLEQRKRALDGLLEGPVRVLEGLRDDERRVERERGDLLSRVDDLERDIDRASRYERELDQAANSYERAKIHEECQDRLGNGSPRAVMGDRRRKLTEAKRGIANKGHELESVRRNVAKAQRRVATTVDRGTRNVQALVIDGSNLCYQGGTFIRLAALGPLCDHLARSYDVTIVFDASIRRKLGGVTDQALREAFRAATVHVVATKNEADETILTVAEDPLVYVLSNDRFAEFRDMTVVRDGRLVRHEIINGRVLVSDLDVTVPFAAI